MKSLLQQRMIIALGLALIAVLIAVITGRTKPSSITMPNQQILVVCPQGPPACRFTHIQAAIDTAPEGAVIAIKTGTYEENLFIHKSLALQAVEGEHVIIKSALERFPTLLLVSGSYPIHVKVRGLTLQPARSQKGSGIEILGMVAAHLESNTFDDYEFAILALGKEAERGLSKLPLVITENTIHSSGIWIRNSAFIEISKNSIRPKVGTLYGGFITIEASGSVTVSENLMEAGMGMWISQAHFVNIERNIIRNGFVGSYIEKMSSAVTLSGNQIEQNGWGVAVTRGSTVSLAGNRVTQQEFYGLVVESSEDIVLCEKNHIRDNKQGDYRVQSPVLSFFGEPKHDPAAEEKLRQQCEGG